MRIAPKNKIHWRNGCGNGTPIKPVVGALKPYKGKVMIDSMAKIEHTAQHHLKQLDPDRTRI